MNLKTLNARHIALISVHWSRYIVRSGAGLVYLMIALIFGLSVAQAVIMPVEQLMAVQREQTGQVDPEAVRNTIINVGRPIAQFVLGIKSQEEITQQAASTYGAPPTARGPRNYGGSFDPWTSFLLEDRPALLSAIFLILIFGMPFAISFLAFNQVTGDIRPAIPAAENGAGQHFLRAIPRHGGVLHGGHGPDRRRHHTLPGPEG
jgi:hypothetical protein